MILDLTTLRNLIKVGSRQNTLQSSWRRETPSCRTTIRWTPSRSRGALPWLTRTRKMPIIGKAKLKCVPSQQPKPWKSLFQRTEQGRCSKPGRPPCWFSRITQRSRSSRRTINSSPSWKWSIGSTTRCSATVFCCKTSWMKARSRTNRRRLPH